MISIIALCLSLIAGPALADLPQPEALIIDKGLPKEESEKMIHAARLFYAFWDTGVSDYAREALSPDFLDRTLPEGRPQGPEGPLFASAHFRQVVPDLHCRVEEMLVIGDRVIARLVFSGHHSGPFLGKEPTGKQIEFHAIDIYRIKDGKITDNWHIEDNLSLFKQLGVI